MTIPAIALNILGPFQLWRGGEPVLIGAKKNRALLAVLALSPGLSTSRERLAGLLWGDRQDEQARSSLRQSLALLRKDLGGAEDAILLSRDDAVGLRPGAVWIDVLEFQRLGKSDDIIALRQAAALCRGEFLADHGGRDNGFENWLSFERARLKQESVKVFDRLAANETGPEALFAAQRLVALDPLREASHRRVMEALFALGDRGFGAAPVRGPQAPAQVGTRCGARSGNPGVGPKDRCGGHDSCSTRHHPQPSAARNGGAADARGVAVQEPQRRCGAGLFFRRYHR